MAEPGRRTVFRCAIYTRKSSEEGLEQDFNSLHAQREACEAYIVSQKHEGWRALAGTYDDGGFSGGSLERPGLRKLLADVTAGQIDVVVVYKVDRLTRSLTDFAKIVEIFDAKGASFVSVTQAFNTTSSMGRLTLNVLLSFAQFEREVTGERIRDKIAASKKKGLWMGGFVPLGYQAAGRTLTIDDEAAATVRTIFERYLALKSVHTLKAELDKGGYRTKRRLGPHSRPSGGGLFSRGHLYRILENPIYSGRIRHKGKLYGGQQPAIIDPATFDAVQAMLSANGRARLVKGWSRNPSLLTGLLFDSSGQSFVSDHCTKDGKRYRYYLSAGAVAARRRGRPSDAGLVSSGDGANPVWRVPAAEIERITTTMLVEALTDERWIDANIAGPDTSITDRQAVMQRAHELAAQLRSDDPVSRRGVVLLFVERMILDQSSVEIEVRATALRGSPPIAAPANDPQEAPAVSLRQNVIFRRRGPESRLVIEGVGPPAPEPDAALIKAAAQAHRWWGDLLDGRYATLREIAAAYATDERYAAWVMRLAFIGPDLTRRILEGTQPPELTLRRFFKQGVTGATGVERVMPIVQADRSLP